MVSVMSEQELFEAWARPDSVQMQRRPETGEYTDRGMSAAWAGWMASVKAHDMRRVGWWVVFEEANDIGEIPDGFFVDDERAKTFGDEPGFLQYHLAPCWIRERT